MNLFNYIKNLFQKDKVEINRVFQKFIKGDNRTFTVEYDNFILGMIERIENLNKNWFKEKSLQIEFESGFLITLCIPIKEKSKLTFREDFLVEEFKSQNSFITIEKEKEFIIIGKFYSKDISHEKLLSRFINYFHEIYIIKNQIFYFDVMKINVIK